MTKIYCSITTYLGIFFVGQTFLIGRHTSVTRWEKIPTNERHEAVDVKCPPWNKKMLIKHLFFKSDIDTFHIYVCFYFSTGIEWKASINSYVSM